MRRLLGGLAALALVVATAAGCGSASHSSSSSKGTKSYTIGVISDITGPLSSAEVTTPDGVKAGVGEAKTEGYDFKYVVADGGSTPTGVLAAAQRLVESDHVFAVILVSGLAYAAAPFLAQHNVPVIGAQVDASEWLTERNMFSVSGYTDYSKVTSTDGLFFKQVGATNFGGIGYTGVPSSQQVIQATADSVKHAGLKVGYLNQNFPLGSTNTGPEAIAMKNAGVDAFTGTIDENTSFALITSLKQEGVHLKAALLPVGYGGDLLKSGPDAIKAAQGAYFSNGFVPVEDNTPATQKFVSAMKQYAGVSEEPTLNQTYGYVAINALVAGLRAAGANPTQADLIDAMLKMTNYNAGGLFGTHSISFALADRGKVAGPDNCTWFVQFQGTSFKPVPNANPLCGSTIPGITVPSPS